MKVLSNYLKAIKELHKYFGYEEEWTVYSFDDQRDKWWKIKGNQYIKYVWFFSTKEAAENDYYDCEEEDLPVGFDEEEWSEKHGDHTFSYLIVDRWETKADPKGGIYRGEKYTMIKVDLQSDDNKFLSVFSNDKEIK